MSLVCVGEPSPVKVDVTLSEHCICAFSVKVAFCFCPTQRFLSVSAPLEFMLLPIHEIKKKSVFNFFSFDALLLLFRI